MSQNPSTRPIPLQHPRVSRRSVIQAGAIGLLGLGTNHARALRAMAAAPETRPKPKSVIYIFLSGGLSQLDSFDLKPDAPDSIRGEFSPTATRTPGIQICEHLPLLAERSEKWALVRSLTHPYNEHSQGHMVMFSGRTPMPTGFDSRAPRPTDWPSMASVAGALMPVRHNLPPAVVLPDKLIHVTGRTIPGQFAGLMGKHRDPWLVRASRFRSSEYIHGAFPQYGFKRRTGAYTPPDYVFEAPSFTLPEDVFENRFHSRLNLLDSIERQRRQFDSAAHAQSFDRYRQEAISLLVNGGTYKAFDVHGADPKLQDRYGRNSFGWSLLMARQLVEAGVSLVQVNLGNNESWDTHEAAFRNLKDFLFPPTDKAVSALLDDLQDRGLFDDTLVVMAGEFGRTPRVFTVPKAQLPGRDHWGAVQTVFFAGGGVRGGTVIGSSDRIGGYPNSDPQKPENMAATIYKALGLPATITWTDKLDRPHHVYYGEPIPKLT